MVVPLAVELQYGFKMALAICAGARSGAPIGTSANEWQGPTGGNEHDAEGE